MKKQIGILAILALSVISCKENAADKFDENAAQTTDVVTTLDEPGTPAAPAVAPEDMPVIKFSTNEVNLGTLKQGDKGEGSVIITNEGKTDLVIFSAQGSCGCTVPETPKEPIKPGGTYEMKVTFDSANKIGDQSKTVTVTANTANGSEKFTVTANVVAQ